MGIKRIVDTSFWTDGKVDEFTPEDKYFMLYLLTNPFTSQLGIYEISIKQVAFQLGYSIEAVRALIERFENTYNIIIFSKGTNEIAIKNFLRHSIIKGGKPVEDCIRKEMLKVKNKNLIFQVFQHISDKDDLNDTVKKIVTSYQNENQNDNDIQNENDNDNDNERIVPRYVDVSYPDTYNDTSKAENIVNLFNSLCPSYSTIKVISNSIKEEIRNTLKEFTEANIQAAFEKAEKSSFLKGENKRKWTASFDWLIKAENIAKILNGNFDNKKEKQSASYDLEAWEREQIKKSLVYAKDNEDLLHRANALKEQLAGKVG